MENSLKYFQPEISDIRVGYECEIKPAKSEEFDWMPYIINGDNSFKNYFKDSIRTPYLTKKQIEAEGWEWMTSYFYKNHKRLNYDYASNRLWVWDMFDNKYFDGYCPSVNEFRTITKLLNIK